MNTQRARQLLDMIEKANNDAVEEERLEQLGYWVQANKHSLSGAELLSTPKAKTLSTSKT